MKLCTIDDPASLANAHYLFQDEGVAERGWSLLSIYREMK